MIKAQFSLRNVAAKHNIMGGGPPDASGHVLVSGSGERHPQGMYELNSDGGRQRLRSSAPSLADVRTSHILHRWIRGNKSIISLSTFSGRLQSIVSVKLPMNQLISH